MPGHYLDELEKHYAKLEKLETKHMAPSTQKVQDRETQRGKVGK